MDEIMPQGQDPVERSDWRDLEELTPDPESLLERLKDINFSEHWKEISIGLGMIAAATATVVAVRKSRNRALFISAGDSRHAPQTVSIGEIVLHGAALALPKNRQSANQLETGSNRKTIFSMGDEGMAYPLNGNPTEVERYKTALRKSANWLEKILNSSQSGDA